MTTSLSPNRLTILVMHGPREPASGEGAGARLVLWSMTRSESTTSAALAPLTPSGRG